MKHVIEHPLSDEQARRALEAAHAEYSQRFAKYSPTLRWDSENRASVAFRAKGLSLSGSVELQPGRLELDFRVPLLLKPFTGKATQVVEREIRRWVDMEANRRD